jgi:polyhydroxyalkanoate synthase
LFLRSRFLVFRHDFSPELLFRRNIGEVSSFRLDQGQGDGEPLIEMCPREKRTNMAFDLPADEMSLTIGEGQPPRALSLEDLDRRLRGQFGLAMGGQSLWAGYEAWSDWAFHLAVSPGRQVELWRQAWRNGLKLGMQAYEAGPQSSWAFQPRHGDRRFRDPAWLNPPFSLLAQTQLALEAQWEAATTGVRGVSDHHQRQTEFLGRFALNALAPTNFAWTNPRVIEAARETFGANFIKGAGLFAEDAGRLAHSEGLTGLEAFQPGKTMAMTKGKVIYRNALMELIQYEPTTPTVHPEPILIAPAWIMKYYILDLTPVDSLVRYLVDQGFTVFIISWRNPGQALRDTSFEDYRREGVLAALDVVGRVVPGEKIHAVGYCLGGTVLSIEAAILNRDGDDRLASLSLLAAQTDFQDAGDLLLFIDDSQLALLEDMMRVQGYLDEPQMAGAFYALRANEMVFAKFVERYLLGEPSPPTPLDAWLADATRMPARMHGEYLRQLFLENRFSHGGYQADGRAVAVKDLKTPTFALGAERDYIAPWKSVYKIVLYSSADTTFVLTGGGHNSSVVSPPNKAGAYYYVGGDQTGKSYEEPELWLKDAVRRQGSWWPEWMSWLKARSESGRVAPPTMGNPKSGMKPMEAAPGRYVHET